MIARDAYDICLKQVFKMFNKDNEVKKIGKNFKKEYALVLKKI